MPSTAAATDQRPDQTQTPEEEVLARPRAQRERGQRRHQLQPSSPPTSPWDLHHPELHQRHRVHLEPSVHLSVTGSAVGVRDVPSALRRIPHDLHTGPGVRARLRHLLVLLHRAGLQLVPVSHAPAAVGHRGRSQPHHRLHERRSQPITRLALVPGLQRRVTGLRRRRLSRLQRPNGILETELQRRGLSGLQGPKLLEVPGTVGRLEGKVSALFKCKGSKWRMP